MNLWIFCWLALKALASWPSAECQTFVPILHSVSQTSLSLAGGTRLSIRGSLLTDVSNDKVEVAVGQLPCKVLLAQTRPGVVTCETAPGLSGTYGITVSVNGSRSAPFPVGLTFSSEATPVVHEVRPSAGPPDGSLSIIGSPHFSCSSQGPGSDFNCIGDLLVGPYRCLLPYGDIEEVFEAVDPDPRWSERPFRVNCTMAGPLRNNPKLHSAVPGLGAAGLFNVTLRLEVNFSGGRAEVDAGAWLYSPDGTPYMYEQYPEVSAVTPSSGSLAGGTRLTIHGRGFPNLRQPPRENTIQVTLAGGVQCTVVDSMYDTITCVTTRSSALQRPSPLQQQQQQQQELLAFGEGNTGVAIGGQYPGMRGAEYQFYPFNATVGDSSAGGGSGGSSPPSFSELWRLNTSLLVSQLEGGYSGVLMNRMEGHRRGGEHEGATATCRRIKGFFWAPRSANYTFVVETGGYAQLNGSWIQDGQEMAGVALVNVTSSSPSPSPSPFATGWSPIPVALSKDQPILLELNQCNIGAQDVPRLGVRVSSSVPRSNSIPEVQRLHVTDFPQPPTLTIRYLYGSFTALDGIRITVVAGPGGGEMLSDPRVGLQLGFGSSIKVVVPLTLDESELAVRLAAALGLIDGGSALSVRRSTNGTAVTLEVAAAEGTVTALRGVIAAAMVELPMPPPPPLLPPPPPPSALSAACRFSNPLMVPVPGSPAYGAMYGAWIGQTTLPSLSQGSLDLSKLNVTVQDPAAAVLNGGGEVGTWTLGKQQAGGVRRLPRSLAYNATPAEVADAVRHYTGLAVNVTLSSASRMGLYAASVWQLTLPDWDSRSTATLAALVPEPASGFPAGAILEYEFAAGTPPGSGAIRVAYGDGCECVVVNVADDPLDVIGAKLASLPGLASPVRVARTTSSNGSVEITVTFDPISNPGDRKALRVVDTSGLVNKRAVAWFTTVVNGTYDQLYLPIPASMMRLAVAAPGSVRVIVNEAPAACVNPMGLCAFSFDASLTPNITYIEPLQLTYDWSQSEIPISIYGSGLAPLNMTDGSSADGAGSTDGDGTGGVTVTISGVNCSVVYVTDTLVVCTLPRDTVPGGLHSVSLLTDGKGYADGTAELITTDMAVYDISPPVISARGMTLISVSGQGFNDGSTGGGGGGNCSRLRASIGSVYCPIVSCGPNILTLLYPGAPGGVGSSGGRGVEGTPIVLQALAPNDTVVVEYSSPPLISALVLTYTAAVLAVNVSSTATASDGVHLAASGGQLLVSLSSDVVPGDVQGIYLVPSLEAALAQANGSPSSSTDVSAARALSLARPCASVTWPEDFSPSSPVAICTTRMTPAGSFHTMVMLSGSGLTLLSPNTVVVDVAVTGISPSTGSAGGGTLLTITGSGFSPVPGQNRVYLLLLPPSPATAVTNTTQLTADSATTTAVQCDILTANTSQITCRTRQYDGILRAQNTGADGGWIMQVQVAVCPPASSSDGASAADTDAARETCIAQGAASRCDGSRESCLFSYVTSETPTIGYISPATGQRGTVITVYGRNLANVTEMRFAWRADTAVRTCRTSAGVAKTTADGDVEAVSCSVPSSLPYGVYDIVLVTDSGTVSVDPYKAARFAYQAVIDNVQPRALSLAGGMAVTVNVQDDGSGGGLQPDGPDTALTVVLGAGLLGPLGLVCPSVTVSGSQLSFTAPSLIGLLLTELWSLPYSVASFGDASLATPLSSQIWNTLPQVADAVFLTSGSTLSPGGAGFRPPADVLKAPLGPSWAAKFTFYSQVISEEDAMLNLMGGVWSMLWIDGDLVSNTSYSSSYGAAQYHLRAGLHKFVWLVYQTTQDDRGVWFGTPSGNQSRSPGASPGADLTKVTPVPPGTPLPVTVIINGAQSVASCAAAALDLRPQPDSQQTLDFEVPKVELALGLEACSLVYSTYMTPTLVAGGGVAASSGVHLSLPSLAEASSGVNWVVHVYGSFLTPDPLIDVRVIVGIWLCELFNATTLPYAVSAGNGAVEVTQLDCTVPPLPSGEWPVAVTVGGLGAARPPVTNAPSQPVATVRLQVADPWAAAQGTAPECQVSLFGGGTVTVAGTGFVAGLRDDAAGREIHVSWDTSSSPASGACVPTPGFACTLFDLPTPPVAAIATSSLPISLSGSTTSTSAAVQIGRYSLPGLARALAHGINPNSNISDGLYMNTTTMSQYGSYPDDMLYIGNSSARSLLAWRLRVMTTPASVSSGVPTATHGVDSGPSEIASEITGHVAMCGSLTPWISDLSPLATTADTSGGSLTVGWRIATTQLTGASGIGRVRVGSLSEASLEFEASEEAGGQVLYCTDPRVISSITNDTFYTETFTCQLPPYMPAAFYTVWLCLYPYGCGYFPGNWTVTPSVAGFEQGSVTQGPTSGGTEVLIRGVGHSLDPTRIRARFGNSTCTITAANQTSFTCLTGPLPYTEIAAASASADPTATLTRTLFVTPVLGTPEIEVPSAVFSFRQDLDIAVLAVSPTRGPSSGGVLLTVTGIGFLSASGVRVFVGDLECGSVKVLTNTSLTCVTPALFSLGSSGSRGSSGNREPTAGLQVTAMPASSKRLTTVAGNSGELPQPSSVPSALFRYMDLWSAPGTWPMGREPQQGEDVTIAQGTTVLLDVSPPALGSLTLYGTLVFDDTQPSLELQATSILVDGGSLLIGGPGEPYSSRATITLLGHPGDSGRYLYGSKVLAVRNGRVHMSGSPRAPSYTTLNATAGPGDTALLVNGPLNWQVGDRIVLFSSSFMADEVDEAVVQKIVPQSGDVVQLLLDTPLSYTHLGAVVQPPSSSRPALPLDMRGFVAVLSRNVRVRGDETSVDTMYGAQMFVHTPDYLPRAVVQLSDVEFVHMGQAPALDSIRYSLHWFQQGDVSGNAPGNVAGAAASWLRSCAIHHVFARGLVLSGTHGLLVQRTLVYDVYGHAVALDTGMETGNVFEGNVAALSRVSPALDIEDTTPAAFWVTNPNNTFRGNVAAGSDHTGFAYVLPDTLLYNASASSSVEALSDVVLPPGQTPIPPGGFNSNMAHSHLMYGMRIHPEYYPMRSRFGFGAFDQLKVAVFQGLVAFRNGFKGFAASSVGLVQLRGAALGANGGGPISPLSRRKDNAAQAEIAWVADPRPRLETSLQDFAGVYDSTVYGTLSEAAQNGTAGRWLAPPDRRIVGVATHSSTSSSSLSYIFDSAMALVNVTFVNFHNSSLVAAAGGTGTGNVTGSSEQQQQQLLPVLSVLEACARCWPGQGGATAFTSRIQFLSYTAAANSSRPVLSYWSWAQQGVYEDLDGTLLSPTTLGLPDAWGNGTTTNISATAAAAFPPAPVPWAGATFHSAVGNDFFDPVECLYFCEPTGQCAATTNYGAICAPRVGPFRRVFLDLLPGEDAYDIANRELVVVDSAANRSMVVPYSRWTEDAAMILVPTRRQYDIHWRLMNGSSLDPTAYTVKHLDALNSSHFLYIKTMHDREYDCVAVNNFYADARPLPSPPLESTSHGSSSFLPIGAAENVTAGHEWSLTTFLAGNVSDAVEVTAYECPAGTCGCPVHPPPPSPPEPPSPQPSLPPAPPPSYPLYPGSPLPPHPSPPDAPPPSLAPLAMPSPAPSPPSYGSPAQPSPLSGFQSPPPPLSSARWSDGSTWALRSGGKPVAYDNVTIEEGWDVLLDESPPPLASLLIRGSVRFDPSVNVELRVSRVLVVGQGSLSAGSETSPHPSLARILLTEPAPSLSPAPPPAASANTVGPIRRLLATANVDGFDLELSLRSKVLAVVDGGRLELWGRRMARRWVHLAVPAEAGDDILVLNIASSAASVGNGTNGSPEEEAEVGEDEGEDSTGAGLSTAMPLGWRAGDRVLVTSTSYNQYQSEIRRILSVVPYSNITNDPGDVNRTALYLDTPLDYDHASRIKIYGGPTDPWVDVRAEVALLSSNVVLAAAEAYDSSAVVPNGWYGSPIVNKSSVGVNITQGAQLYVGPGGVVHLNDVAIEYCGQIGEETKPCVMYDNPLSSSANDTVSDGGSTAAHSYIRQSSIVSGVGGNVLVSGGNLTLHGNVFFASYGSSNVHLLTSGNTLTYNLALGAVDSGTSANKTVTSRTGSTVNGTAAVNGSSRSTTTAYPGLANYLIRNPKNWVQGNVAAGSDRFGFILYGQPCSDVDESAYGTTPPPSPSSATTLTHGSVLDNVAHSCLAGMWLRSSAASRAANCTALSSFIGHTNWDFGIITMRGIDTDVRLYDIKLYDNKHAGAALLLRRDMFTTPRVAASWRGGLLVGRSSHDVCALCTAPSDAGCHQRLVAGVSYNRELPYSPALGLVAATFAQGFSMGPDSAPWDAVQGYGLVYGHTNISNVTVADFGGSGGCGGGEFAFANNPAAPDAFHPHYFSGIRVMGTNISGPNQGLFFLTAPDPAWRNTADCGTSLLTVNLTSTYPEVLTLVSNTSSNGSVVYITATTSSKTTTTTTTTNDNGGVGSLSATAGNDSAATPVVVSLNCGGPAHVFFGDRDGSLLGQPGAVVGGYPLAPRPNPVAQGSLLTPPDSSGRQTCSYSSDYGSYICTGSSVLGPHPFVLASRDNNSETQGPDAVLFESGGAVDVVVPAMDQSWCFGSAECRRRLSAFWTYLPGNTSTRVTFIGAPPSVSEAWLPSAAPGTELLLAIQYPANSTARRFIWTVDTGRLQQASAAPSLYDGSSHGSYYWEPAEAVLYVKLMGGGSSLQIRTESAAVISLVLDMHIADFTSERRQRLLFGLKNASGVLQSQLQILRAVAGSVQVNLVVYGDPETASGSLPDPWAPWSAAASLDVTSQVTTTLHYTTLHYTTLHYTTLHYTTLHYTTLHYTTLHYTTLHYTTLHYTTLHYTTLHYTTLRVITDLAFSGINIEPFYLAIAA
ncbi:hypothetical protein Vafri_130 [Volvox africanus]|nr:hypothetical protein Vafri_130 [Volvox africanus]